MISRMATQQQAPSPRLIFSTFNAYQRTAALRAGVELDVFTAIGEGNQVPGEIAKRCEASERGIRILCDFLVISGLLDKHDGRYVLTPDSAMFLDRRSPACIAAASAFLTSPMLTSGFDDLASVVRKGGTIVSAKGTMEPDHPVWVDFARSMAPMMVMPSRFIAGLVAGSGRKVEKVLDIAAGHGLFGIAVAQAMPEAHIFAVDWENVLTVAQENARAAGVESRLSTLPGSAFEVDFGTGYDLVLLTNFLHHFDAATCENLMRKIRGSLAKDGRVITLEFVPDEDRVTPPAAAGFSLMMLGSTAHGDAYTFSELDRMFRNAGFAFTEIHAVPESPQSVIVSSVV
jgi:ubiquinone/menaquinone biosynthesis C-methylase UbiE